MRKPLFLAAVMMGLATALPAALITNPSSGTVNVGQTIGVRTDCLDLQPYIMRWGDGTSVSGKDSGDFYYSFRYHLYRNPGTYLMHLRRLPGYYCPNDEYKSVTVLENRSITIAPPSPYLNQLIQFTAVNFQTPADITWDMGDGTVYSHRGSAISHTYTKAGNFTVRAYDWKGDTTTTPVTVSLAFVRGILFSPAVPRVDEPVEIRANGFLADSIDWNFGDGTPPLAGATAVIHRYQAEGTFIITAREHGRNDMPLASRAIAILPENRSLTLSVSEARADEPVTITALNFRGPQILWDFGDGTVVSGPAGTPTFSRTAALGAATITHAYKLPGNYTITARDENGASEKKFQATVKILGISDQVNLEIAEITLDNGKYYKVVPRHSKNLRAQLKMKMRGTGIVSGYWIVDGQPYQFFNETVYQGQIKTILIPDVPGLPVFDPGMHTITMQLTRPQNEAAVFPTLRYFVLPYDNLIETISPINGAIIKEDEIAEFYWKEALGGSHYQVAFCNSLFPLLRDAPELKWKDCPDRLNFTPDAETWRGIKRNQWTYWKVRAMDSARDVVAESGVLEMKIIVPGAKVGIERVTDLGGAAIPTGPAFTASRSEQVLIHGSLSYPADAEFLILRVFANGDRVDQLLFRDVKKDEARRFETSVPNLDKETLVAFEVLKSSSPSLVVGYLEMKLKHE